MVLELVPKGNDSSQQRSVSAEESPGYQGVERRRMTQRKHVDRRSMIRFESINDRRHGGERRDDLRRWVGRD